VDLNNRLLTKANIDLAVALCSKSLRGFTFLILHAWHPNGTQMPQLLITDKVLEKADPAKSPMGRLEIWDTYLPGFGYRATQRGRGALCSQA
jgi:hypothetical protein